MKKVFSILTAIVLLVQLSGCGAYQIMTADSNRIDEMSEEIIRCLIEKDRDALEALFCHQVSGILAFEAQMDALYAFFDYDYFFRYDINGSHAESDSTEYGERVQWSVCAEIVYIEVFDESLDDSRFYCITYNWTPVYQEDSSLVGLHTVTVHLLNTDQQVTLGTCEYFPF